MARIGVFGDIHANLNAFAATLDAMASEGCDAFVCTGDVVGYGPRPAECIALIRERQIPCVLGNHDHYVTLLGDPRVQRLRPEVRASVEWTQSVLGMDDLKWLAALPQRLEFDEGFGVVHGSFGPNPWVYLTSEARLRVNFAHQQSRIAFCGHTHVPFFAMDAAEQGSIDVCYLKQADIPPERRVMSNVGSVGQPRDHDPRAAFAVWDMEDATVKLVRVPYDLEETQQRMRDVGLPDILVERLRDGR